MNYVAIWLCGHVATLLRGYVAMWLRGHVTTRGHVVSWLRGHMAIWLRGYVGKAMPHGAKVLSGSNISISSEVGREWRVPPVAACRRLYQQPGV